MSKLFQIYLAIVVFFSIANRQPLSGGERGLKNVISATSIQCSTVQYRQIKSNPIPSIEQKLPLKQTLKWGNRGMLQLKGHSNLACQKFSFLQERVVICNDKRTSVFQHQHCPIAQSIFSIERKFTIQHRLHIFPFFNQWHTYVLSRDRNIIARWLLLSNYFENLFLSQWTPIQHSILFEVLTTM